MIPNSADRALLQAPPCRIQTAASLPPCSAILQSTRQRRRKRFLRPFLSNGVNLNAVLYTANGVGPHPNVLILHGLPGNEQNIDLAQSMRQAGGMC
jgi:hypothetical protein